VHAPGAHMRQTTPAIARPSKAPFAANQRPLLTGDLNGCFNDVGYSRLAIVSRKVSVIEFGVSAFERGPKKDTWLRGYRVALEAAGAVCFRNLSAHGMKYFQFGPSVCPPSC
jgi:hypothetical protein